MRFLLCLTVFGFLSFLLCPKTPSISTIPKFRKPSEKSENFMYTSQSFTMKRKTFLSVWSTFWTLKPPAFYNNAKSIIDYLVWSYQVMPHRCRNLFRWSGPEFIPIDKMNPENGGTSTSYKTTFETKCFHLYVKNFALILFVPSLGIQEGCIYCKSTLFGEQRDMFNAYLAISPSMGYFKGSNIEWCCWKHWEKTQVWCVLYASYGSVGSIEQNNETYVHYLDSLWNRYPNPNMHWISKKFEGTSHWGVVAPSVADGILEMNRAYQVDQFLVEKFVKQSDNNHPNKWRNTTARSRKNWDGPSTECLRFALLWNSTFWKWKIPARFGAFRNGNGKRPFNINTYFNMVWAYRELNRMEEAKAMYLRKEKKCYNKTKAIKTRYILINGFGRIQKQLDEIER